jgi:DNA-binding NarL/FixJ family response regulator
VHPLRILVVDDDPHSRQRVTSLLADEPGVEIAGQASSGEEALAKAAQLEPDLVVMDVQMPGMSGLQTLERIKKQAKVPLVILMTLSDYPGYSDLSKLLGADGFISKRDLPTALPTTIKTLFPRPEPGPSSSEPPTRS